MNSAPKGPYSDGKRPCVADSEASSLVLNALKRDRFAAVLDDPDLEQVSLQMEVSEVSGVVFREGAPADTVLVLQEGSLEVSVCGRHLETLGPGACVGSAGVLRKFHLHTVSTPSGISALVWSTSIHEICRLLNKWEEKHHAENWKLIERILLFDFLPDQQKARLSELPVRVQVFQAGDLVSSKGDMVSSIFVVKTGRLRGVLDPPGHHPTPRLHAKYLPGDVVCSGCCLPQRRQFPLRWHVVADTDCKMLSLDFQTLLQLFGDDLDECLQRAFMVFGLNQVPFMAGFSCTQKLLLAKAMEVAVYKPGETLVDVQFAVIFDGAMLVERDDVVEELGHGDRYIDSTLFSPQEEAERIDLDCPEDQAPLSEAARLVAGDAGLTVATLAGKGAAQAFKELGVSPVLSAEDTTDIALEVLQARRVSVLRHLSCNQIERLVKQLVPRVYACETLIFEQGEIGTAFYIIASGQVQVSIDGKPVRTLARHGHFGERALLFEEPRSASVRVLSVEAELWCLEKAAFVEVLTDHLREEIMRRIEIQDSNVELQDLTHVRVIGIGGFGNVRLVEDRHTGLRYALKQVKKVDGIVPDHVRGECGLLAEMDHPFILDIMNTYETSTSLYILMEYIMGGTLRHVIKVSGALDRAAACFYVGSLILVLEVLHDRNIVYRDLKPENVMVDSRGYVKLIDFGIAKRLDQDGRTFTCIGSPHYMAPEAILSRREGYGTEVDTWALGILLFELVCGCRPFGDGVKDKQEVFEAILKQALKFPESYSDECGRDLLQAMLQKSPENRLGDGVFGWDDIKEHPYFTEPSSNLFDGIVERLVRPPYTPTGECPCDGVPQEVTKDQWREEKTIARTRTTLVRRSSTVTCK